jgi:hypothetical protein
LRRERIGMDWPGLFGGRTLDPGVAGYIGERDDWCLISDGRSFARLDLPSSASGPPPIRHAASLGVKDTHFQGLLNLPLNWSRIFLLINLCNRKKFCRGVSSLNKKTSIHFFTIWY